MGQAAPCESHGVLVVDDDGDIRQFLSELLSMDGYTVRTAVNGREALLALREFRPCLILLDLMMPVLDGWGFCRERQKVPELAQIPVAVMSAGHNLAQGQPPCNPVALFPKPFDIFEFAARVEQIVA